LLHFVVGKLRISAAGILDPGLLLGSLVELCEEGLQVMQGHRGGAWVFDEICYTSLGGLKDPNHFVPPRGVAELQQRRCRGSGPLFADDPGEVVGGGRLADEEALDGVAGALTCEYGLLEAFDAFGDHGQVE